MRKPNFFIVGAPKCGTTAMHTYLEQHPDVFMADKEINHFCRELYRDQQSRSYRIRENDAFYHQLFANARDESVVGESSVFYMCSRFAAKRIHDYDPEARILIHVRNPVEFVPSHHSQLVFVGYEDITDVVAAYDAEDDRRAGRRIPRNCRLRTILNYREMATFSEQIERFFDAFGRERVLVHLFDDFRADTPAVYRRTLEFLDLDPSFRPAFDVVNANKRHRSRRLQLFLRETPDWVSRLGRMVAGQGVRRRLRNRLADFNTVFTPRSAIDPAFAARIRRDMRPEIERLGALLGRDLSHWYEEPQATRDAGVASPQAAA